MNPVQRIMGRIREFFTTASDAMSFRLRTVTRRNRSLWSAPTQDWARSDYLWWRRAYFCQVRGLELSGLFLRPLIQKTAAWTLGRAPTFQLDDQTSADALIGWWGDHHPEIITAYTNALREGDGWLVVNGDLTLTLVPGETVDPIVADDDYAEIIGWRVTQVLAHPETLDRMTTVDEYYAGRRVHRVLINGVMQSEETFDNLIGGLPIVHIPNTPLAGSPFGHPEGEPLVELFHRYGEVLEAAIEGNKTQGRPTPVASFATIADLDKFWDQYGTTETLTLPSGGTEKVSVLDVDLSQLLTLSGATFEYKAPGPFTEDTVRLLELMFYLFLEHAEIPEFVMGNAIASSKASAETQLPVFVKYIEMRQGKIAGWITELAQIVLGYLALTEPGVIAATPTLTWDDLSSEEGTLTLSTVQWAFAEGLIDSETALMLAPVDIDDPAEVLRKAQAEAEAHASARPEVGEAQMDRQLRDEIESLEI